MAHAQKPDFVFWRNGRVHFNRQGGRHFSRLLAAEVVMLGTPCSVVVRRLLATNSIRQFPLYFPSIAAPCAITFQLDSNIVFFLRGPSRCVSSIIYCISTVNTQHMQRPDVLVQLGYIWRHVSAVKRSSQGQQRIVLLRYGQIVCPVGSHCSH